ncbi:hypothetical protein GT347_10730 [Xylophilus rhododendri]|uniref:Ketopantoate reductase C-terminal domain-containing protein n=1 Tax=Xylophilus rhododendri TaxID=2697032 RepID=A0A857J436_9BURK|nr:ketopantoate reductase family protein [Xylophilus rhododendri]QHI98427.1 hypothetical protein GT347_10730 [Xylophilus rhododendri]
MKTIFQRARVAGSTVQFTPAANCLRHSCSLPTGEAGTGTDPPSAGDGREPSRESDFSPPPVEERASRPLHGTAGFPALSRRPSQVLVLAASGSQSSTLGAQALANAAGKFEVRLVTRRPAAFVRNATVRCGDLHMDIAQHPRATVADHTDGLDPDDLLVLDATAVPGLDSTIALTPPGSRVLYTQNGVPTHEAQTRQRGLEVHRGASMITSSRRPPQGGVTVAPGGRLLVDQNSSIVDILAEVLRNRGFFELVAVPDIRATQFEKIALNCALNVVATLSGRTLGELLQLTHQDARAENLIGGLAAEVCAIAVAQGIRIKPTDQVIGDIQRAMACFPQHPTSMRMAFEAGHASEIDVLNGAISRLGRECGIATPLNDLVTEKLRMYHDVREADGVGDGFHQRHRPLVALVLEELLLAARRA